MSPVQRYLTVAIIFLLKFSFQDPLEQYFSQQHHRGGSKDNPTVNEYFENVATLHVRLLNVKLWSYHLKKLLTEL